MEKLIILERKLYNLKDGIRRTNKRSLKIKYWFLNKKYKRLRRKYERESI